jgi:hypothetical protein
MGNIELTVESAGALSLLFLSLAMIGCGVGTCWLKFGRGENKPQKRAPRAW